MYKILSLVFFFNALVFGANQCIICHKGIEDIRDRESLMMKEILKIADKAGHKGNDCIVCHGGNPKSKNITYAHNGTVKYFKTNKGPKEYYKSPTNPWINENTCGICHSNQVDAQMNSLMMSEQGTTQNILQSFGIKDNNETIANYNSKNPDDLHKRVGSDVYKKYMYELSTTEPQAFVSEVHEMSDAPTIKDIQKNPSLAVYTYLRQDKNKHMRGCSSCHIPYAKDGLYRGNDKKISNKKGHLLTHKIQSSRNIKIQVDDINYSGIPVETCTTCHNSLKSIGTSYQGLIQPEIGSKNYLHSQEDIHFKKGMLCQDCHTSNDLHGDGFLNGASAGAVEIECQDCHGTTKEYPWELPIGYSDEFNTTKTNNKARGVAQDLAKYLKQSYITDKKDGYILTARGNPFPKAVKSGNKIIIYLANGNDIELKPLKLLKESKKLSKDALLAMDTIESHTSKMECYTCHATWAPQSYGHKVTIDYSRGKKNIDYLAASHDKNGNIKKYMIDGEITKKQSYFRWEEPTLIQNAEGRISPAIPGDKTSIEVIYKDEKSVLKNYTFNTASIIPIQPHTVGKKARDCESCHVSSKALGLGIDTSLKDNYSRFIDKNGTKLMRVGDNFKLTSPLNKAQVDKLDRRGACISCHKDIPEGNLAISVMSHISKMSGHKIDTKEHADLLNILLDLGAWIQIVLGIFITMAILYGIYASFFKKKPNNPRNEGWK